MRNCGVGVMLAGAMLLGACGDSSSTAAPTTSRLPATTAASSSTTSAPSSTVVPGAVVVDSTAVALRGVGPVTFGMTIANVEKVAASRLLLDGPAATATGCQVMHLERGPAGLTFSIAKGVVERLDVREGSALRTRSGIGVNSTVDQLQKAYGAQAQKHPDGTTWVYVPKDAVDADYRVVFETDGTKVLRYRAGKVPLVLAPAPC